MTASRVTAIALAFALALCVAEGASAAGIDLGRAKGQGLVGEKADGYVGIVPVQTVSLIQALVNGINRKRRAAYEEIARKHGVSVDAVSVLAGAKLVDRASRGQWVTDADGVWRRK